MLESVYVLHVMFSVVAYIRSSIITVVFFLLLQDRVMTSSL